ncbi:MAG: acyl-CoA dehydrogenase family protein, partial [Candidatus Poseidoniaceae archaeon]
MEPFEGLDFYDIESLLTEEEIMIRDMVRDWVDEEVIPKIEHACEEGIFPDEWRVALGEMGVLGMTVDEEFGGAGLGYLEHVIAMEEISRASASIGLSYGTHSNLCVNQINRNGSQAQKE